VSTFIEQLADFAVTTERSVLPATVVERVRLQHMHMAAAVSESVPPHVVDGFVRSAPSRGSARVVAGRRSSSARAAARIHAARAAYVDRLDHLLGGSTGVGAVSAAWAFAKGAKVEDLLVATAVANEVAGRVGASMLLGPHHGFGSGWVHSVSAAVSAGKLLNLSAAEMSNAIGLALMSAGPIPRSVWASVNRTAAIGNAVASGVEAAQLAQKGARASLDLLEAPGGLLENACWIPLSHSFTALGEAWLTHTLSFPRWPGPVAWHAVYDSVNSVLERHVKAADKRLRVDQVLEIHVKVPAPSVAMDAWFGRIGLRDGAGLPHAVRHGIGALIARHELGVAQMDGADWEQRKEAYGDVASRVKVEHDLSLTLDFMAQVVESVAPLVGGITEAEWRGLMERVARPEVGWPSMKWSDARSLLRHRPDKWLKKVRFAPVSLAEGRLDEWQIRLGASVEVYTTRGGKWPENRSIPDHSPGTPWSGTIGSVHSCFSRADPKRAKTCDEVWEYPPGEGAEDWVDRLLE